MRPQRDLVTIDGRPHHRWGDGTTLPVLSGGDGEPDTDDPDDEDDGDDLDVEWEDRDGDRPPPKNPPKSREALHREAGKYRTQRNKERQAHDETRAKLTAAEARIAELEGGGGPSAWGQALISLALRAAVGDTAHDLDAVAKLINPSRVTVEPDGSVKGVDREVERLRLESPFLWKPDDDGEQTSDTARNPFAAPRRTGRPINRAGKASASASNLNRAALQSKYPALRGGR